MTDLEREAREILAKAIEAEHGQHAFESTLLTLRSGKSLDGMIVRASVRAVETALRQSHFV